MVLAGHRDWDEYFAYVANYEVVREIAVLCNTTLPAYTLGKALGSLAGLSRRQG